MSWMDNLKVVFKMVVLGVIAVAGLLGVSIAGYLGLNTVRGDLNTMYESSVKGIDYAGSAMSNMRYAQGMVIIMTTCRDDPARLQELNQKYQAGAKQVDDAIAGYNAIDVDDAASNSLMEDVESEWQNVHATFDQVAKLSLEGKYDEAIDLYSKTGAKQATQMGKNLIALTQDAEQGILTYEDILALPPERIAAADYRALEGVNCIYVETEPDDAGYVERYWVSVSSGLLAAAERECDDAVVYRMAALTVSYDGVDAEDFTLPNGTVLYEPAVAATKEISEND